MIEDALDADQLCPTSAEGGAVRFVRYRYVLPSF